MRTPSNSNVHSRTQESTLVLKANAEREPRKTNADSSMLMLPRRLRPPGKRERGKGENYESVMVAKVQLVVRKSRAVDRYTNVLRTSAGY